MNQALARLLVHTHGPDFTGTTDHTGQPFSGLADALDALTERRHAHAATAGNGRVTWEARLDLRTQIDHGRKPETGCRIATLTSGGETAFNADFERHYYCVSRTTRWFSNHGPAAVWQTLEDLPTLAAHRAVHGLVATEHGSPLLWVDLHTGELARFVVTLTGFIHTDPVVAPPGAAATTTGGAR